MQSRFKSIPYGLALVGLAVLVARCESTDLTAPADGQILVSAVPQTAVIDDESARGHSTIQARVLDAAGIPVEDASVVISPSAGSLVDNACSGGACTNSSGGCVIDADCPLPPSSPLTVKSDGSGFTPVFPLVVTADDPETVTVTATSGAAVGSANVTNELGRVNEPPVADLSVTPSETCRDAANVGFTCAPNGGPIDFDGTGSFDPDGDEITCYEWEISSSIPIEDPNRACVPANPKCDVIQGTNKSFITLNYLNEQKLNVRLRVSDDPDVLPCGRSDFVDDALFSEDAASSGDYMLCNNQAPTAVAGNYGPVTRVGGVASVVMDANKGNQDVDGDGFGDGSFDPESPLSALTFDWRCGNGDAATGQVAVCNYDDAGTFPITLTVTDPGNGQPACKKTSLPGTTSIVVN